VEGRRRPLESHGGSLTFYLVQRMRDTQAGSRPKRLHRRRRVRERVRPRARRRRVVGRGRALAASMFGREIRAPRARSGSLRAPSGRIVGRRRPRSESPRRGRVGPPGCASVPCSGAALGARRGPGRPSRARPPAASLAAGSSPCPRAAGARGCGRSRRPARPARPSPDRRPRPGDAALPRASPRAGVVPRTEGASSGSGALRRAEADTPPRG
jgi:hypothetical protein